MNRSTRYNAKSARTALQSHGVRCARLGALTVALGFSASCVGGPDSELALDTAGLRTNPAIIISEVYGGGGNNGATLTHDFIEIFNRSSRPILLADYSLQYTSATGVTLLGANSALITELPGVTLLPGQFFLVQEAQGNGGTTALPTPDQIDLTPIAMSGTGGKLALVSGTEPLGCNGAPTACTPEAAARIIDLVGIGNASFFEGTAATPAPANATSVARIAACVDSNNNAGDFAVGTPSPSNSATPLTPCAPAADAGAIDAGPDAGGSDAGVDAGPNAGGVDAGVDAGRLVYTRIHDIQGRAHLSGMVGQTASNVPGIVTVVRSNGFYLQDAEPDADDATSEALFVFTSTAPTVAVGDSILVDGRVSEFRPGCGASCAPSNSAYNGLTITQLERPTHVAILARAQALPAATLLGEGGRAIPNRSIDDDTSGPDVEIGPTAFDPASDGLDYFESLEGMRVQLNDAVATGPTQRFGATSRDLTVLADNGRNAGLRSEGSGVVIASDDYNPERIFLTNTLVSDLPLVNVGARFPGVIEGVIDYSFGNFKLLFTTALPRVAPSLLAPEVTSLAPATASELSIATFNVENLSPLDPAAKFAALAALIVHNLAAPDLLALEEVQDNNGPTNDAIVDASQTYAALIAAISAAGGPLYDFRSIDPVDDQDGGQPGGNIRVGFLFRTDRGLSFVDRAGALSDTANSVVNAGGAPQLAFSPGRLDPANTAFRSSRKPLAGEFIFAGRPLFVVANHFNSKGGDQPLFGRFQPPVLSSAAQRAEQARIVAAFVTQIRAIDANAHVVVLGDINDFEFSEAVRLLETAGLTGLVKTLPPQERYSYVFQGNAQVLDHIMVSPSLLARTLGFDIVHVNAEFVDQASDHDPSVARVLFSPPAQRLTPVFECVAKSVDGRLAARFGYNNPNAFRVYMPIGNNNRFIPSSPLNRGQTVVFEPGRQRAAFDVPFNGSFPLVWLLERGLAVGVNIPLLRCR